MPGVSTSAGAASTSAQAGSAGAASTSAQAGSAGAASTSAQAGSARGGARGAGLAALGLTAASLIVLAVVMALGPSAAVPQVGLGGPLWWANARPPMAAVIALERVGLLCGALGVALGLAAVRRGWRPSVRLLLGAGVAAAAVYVFLPPAGSIDVLNYAIYGRIASVGHNPYLMRPIQLYRSGDPVGLFAPPNWRTLPTIYGPAATALQWAAARLGGGSMARIVFWIRLGNAVAYVATAAGLARLAGTDRSRQARICLLWAVNPLMLFWLVGSGHVDVLLALLVVVSLLTCGGRGLARAAVTGLITGAATAIKTPFALAAAGLAWAGRRSPRTVAAGAGGLAAVLIPCYLVPGALNAGVLSRRLTVSAGFIYPVPAAVATRPALFGVLVLAATLLLAALLLWRLPAAGPPAGEVTADGLAADGVPGGVTGRRSGTGHPGGGVVPPGWRRLPATRPVMALVLAWLTVFPVQAPWYDALAFPILALLPWSRLDYVVLARCLLLSEMLLPGVLPNSGSLSIAIARFSHGGLVVVFGALLTLCAFRAWGVAPPASAPPASAPPGALQDAAGGVETALPGSTARERADDGRALRERAEHMRTAQRSG